MRKNERERQRERSGNREGKRDGGEIDVSRAHDSVGR